MQLELGKRYVLRNKLVTEPLEESVSDVFPFTARASNGEHMSWGKDGRYTSILHQNDIVAEYVPDPEPEVQLTPVNLTADDLELIRQQDDEEPDVIPGPGVRKCLFRYRTRYDDNEPWQDWSYVTAKDLDTVMRWMLSIEYICRNIEINLVAESFGEL